MAKPYMSGSSRLARVMTAAELAAAGVSRGQLRRLVRRGTLLRLGHGEYAPAEQVAAESRGRAGEHAVRAAAALARISSQAVVSHHSAALIHGIEMLGKPPAGTVALTGPPGATSRRTCRTGIRLHVA